MDHLPVEIHQAIRNDLQRTSDNSVERFALELLETNILKKLKPRDSKVQDAAAFATFLEANERCASLEVERSPVVEHLSRSFEAVTWRGSYTPFSFDELVAEADWGPGASVGQSNHTHPEKVRTAEITFTEGSCLSFYKAVAARSSFLFQAEEARQSAYGARRVDGSNISFVPKDIRKSRMICTEPSCNMLLQKAIGNVMEKALRLFHHIDLSQQPDINQDLAQMGSNGGGWSTIDLSSASDSISLVLCEAILPGYLMELLLLARSHKGRYKGEWIELQMLSTMGNGFTFPFQTLLFAFIAEYATRDYVGPTGPHGKPYSVFGDDIIVPDSCYDRMVDYLVSLGFVVNVEKSFTAPSEFRESCGGDYFRGRYVRSVYCKALLRPDDWVALYNGLTAWSFKVGFIPWSLLSYVFDRIPKERRNLVPHWEDERSGIRGPSPNPDRSGRFKYIAWKPVSKVLTYRSFERAILKKEGAFAYCVSTAQNAWAYSMLRGMESSRVARRQRATRLSRCPMDTVHWTRDEAAAVWIDRLTEMLLISQP